MTAKGRARKGRTLRCMAKDNVAPMKVLLVQGRGAVRDEVTRAEFRETEWTYSVLAGAACNIYVFIVFFFIDCVPHLILRYSYVILCILKHSCVSPRIPRDSCISLDIPKYYQVVLSTPGRYWVFSNFGRGGGGKKRRMRKVRTKKRKHNTRLSWSSIQIGYKYRNSALGEHRLETFQSQVRETEAMLKEDLRLSGLAW